MRKELYEIILLYNSYFTKKINEDKSFFDELMSYALHRGYQIDFICNFINIDTFINILDNNKENIYNNLKNSHDSKIIMFDQNLIQSSADLKNIGDLKDNYVKKKENIIDKIESILEYFKLNQIILAYFPNEFWKEFLNKFNEQALENIGIYNKIRSAFVNYFSLLTDLKRIIRSENLDKYYNEAEKFYD